MLGLSESNFIPLVVFSVSSELKIKTSKTVIYTSKLKKTVLTYSDIKFSELQIKQIAGKILSSNIDSKENRKNHVDMIKTDINTKKADIAINKCPKCGGNMVDRKGRYGNFKGCSNFPKCRFTLK